MRARRGEDPDDLRGAVAELSAVVSELRDVTSPAEGTVGERLEELERRVSAIEERLDSDLPPAGPDDTGDQLELEDEALQGDAFAADVSPEPDEETGAGSSVAEARAQRAARLMGKTASTASQAADEAADADDQEPEEGQEAARGTKLSTEKLARARRKQRVAERRAARRGTGPETQDAESDEESGEA